VSLFCFFFSSSSSPIHHQHCSNCLRIALKGKINCEFHSEDKHSKILQKDVQTLLNLFGKLTILIITVNLTFFFLFIIYESWACISEMYYAYKVNIWFHYFCKTLFMLYTTIYLKLMSNPKHFTLLGFKCKMLPSATPPMLIIPNNFCQQWQVHSTIFQLNLFR